jgi:hypothetical protein
MTHVYQSRRDRRPAAAALFSDATLRQCWLTGALAATLMVLAIGRVVR